MKSGRGVSGRGGGLGSRGGAATGFGGGGRGGGVGSGRDTNLTICGRCGLGFRCGRGSAGGVGAAAGADLELSGVRLVGSGLATGTCQNKS